MKPLPKSTTFIGGGVGAPGIAGIPSCGIFGICGIGGKGITRATSLIWSNKIACWDAGFVMTEVFPISTRILPSLARINCDADCCRDAPGMANCKLVVHWPQASGRGVGLAPEETVSPHPQEYHAHIASATAGYHPVWRKQLEFISKPPICLPQTK